MDAHRTVGDTREVPLALIGWLTLMLQHGVAQNEEMVLRHLMDLPLNTILTLEHHSPVLATIMHDQHWWELLYVKWFPITYQRLQHKPLNSNANVFLSQQRDDARDDGAQHQNKNLYRDLWIAQARWSTDALNSKGHLVHTPPGANIAPAIGDEYGLGALFATCSPHILIGSKVIRTPHESAPQSTKESRRPSSPPPPESCKGDVTRTLWQWRQFQIYPPERVSDPNNLKQYEATAIPLQGKLILRLFKPAKVGHLHGDRHGDDLVLLNLDLTSQPPAFIAQDMSYWAINYPEMDELNVPPFLDGDPSLEIPSIAATEKSARHTNVHQNGVTAVLIDRVTPPPYDLLIFDEVYLGIQAATTWKGICTSQLQVQNVVICMVYVLDSFLLLATTDGTFWARPRNNPQSMYFVEKLPPGESPITFMTALYNVVAFMSARNTILQVRHVKRCSVDPWIVLEPVYRSTSEGDHCISSVQRESSGSSAEQPCPGPLFLFGPYLLYQSREMQMDVHDGLDEKLKTNEHADLDLHLRGEKELDQEEEPITQAKGNHVQTHTFLPDWRNFEVPPSVYKKTKNWYRNRKHFLKRFGPYKEELEEQQRQEEEARRKEEKTTPVAPHPLGAQFILLNYELKTRRPIHFPLPLFGDGMQNRGQQREEWRVLRIKMANHSHWVITFFSRGKLIDVIFHP